MENQFFTPTNPLCVWVQRILPLVYDDSLSYYELLAKVVEKINILINNNNNIPAYVKEVFDEYIQSGELEKIVKQIIDGKDIVVNVKYPPESVIAAAGDGATNDTDAFNSAIAYAIKHGIPVYIPDGVYMVDAMTINGNVQIFGTPLTALYLIVKPEAGAMFAVEGGNVGFFNFTAYGQHAKQPNNASFLFVNNQNANVNIHNVTVRQFNRGFELINGKSFNAESCVFVDNGMNAITTSNTAHKVTINNCIFNGLTERNATTYIVNNSNGLRIMNAEFSGNASIGINYVDSKDVFIHYYKSEIATPVTGTGINPFIIENNGKIKYAVDDDITAYIANLIMNTSGDMTLETHDMTINAERLVESINGEKVSQAAKRTDVVTGTSSLNAGAVDIQTAQGEKHEVAGQFNVHAGSYKMLDVVRRTAPGAENYVDEAPFVDNAGNNKALLVKGQTDINTAISALVGGYQDLEQNVQAIEGNLGNLPDRVSTLESDFNQLSQAQQSDHSDIEDLQREIAQIETGELTTTSVNITQDKIITGPTTSQITNFKIVEAGYYLIQTFAYKVAEIISGYAYITTNPTSSTVADQKYINLGEFPLLRSHNGAISNIMPMYPVVAYLTAGTWYLYGTYTAEAGSGNISFNRGTVLTLTKLSN